VIGQFVVLSAAVGVLALTVTTSGLFEPVRERVPSEFLKKLVSCPFCFSHWTAALIVLLTWFDAGYNPFVGWLSLTGGGSMWAYVWLRVAQIQSE
jgi:hypothetical protein